MAGTARTRRTRQPSAEAVWQQQVVDLLRLGGWRRIFHAPHGGHGGRLALGQLPEGTGFPDLVAIRESAAGTADLLVAELKAEGGELGPQQPEWLKAFRAAGVDAYLWYPEDIDEVKTRLLTRPARVVGPGGAR